MPTIYGRRMQGYTITLPPAYVEKLRRMGNGNLSSGIRTLLEKLVNEPNGKNTVTSHPAAPQGKKRRRTDARAMAVATA